MTHKRAVRVVAILAVYNEERFIAACLENLINQGTQVHLIDNCSTDQTVAIAQRYLGRGLLDIETLTRNGVFSLRAQLQRKEELAEEIDADWFLHVDADEIRLPPHSSETIVEALTRVDSEGYNAVNFLEYTFIPTREAPDHDHADFQKTMRRYYPFLPRFPHRLNAWKRQLTRVELAFGGHRVKFPHLRMYPESFRMRHYLFLSVPHAIQKYVERSFDPQEIQAGWHGWRNQLTADMILLPAESELRYFLSDDELDPSNPRQIHYLEELMSVGTRHRGRPQESQVKS